MDTYKDAGLSPEEEAIEYLKTSRAHHESVPRRRRYAELNPHAEEDQERWRLYSRTVENEAVRSRDPFRSTKTNHDEWSWSLHFERYLDDLSVSEMALLGEKFLTMSYSDISATDEYYILIGRLTRMYASKQFGNQMRFEYGRIGTVHDALVVNVGGKEIVLPLSEIKNPATGELIYSFSLNLPIGCDDDRFPEQQKLCADMMNAKDIDEAYAIYHEDHYNAEAKEKRAELKEQLLSNLDLVAVADSVKAGGRGEGVIEYLKEGFNSLDYQALFSRYYGEQGKPFTNWLLIFVNKMATMTEEEKNDFSGLIGRVIGEWAGRSVLLSGPEIAFIIESGLLEIPEIKESFETVVHATDKNCWGAQGYDPIRDSKMYTVFNVTRSRVGNKLPDRVMWTEFIENPVFALDMTRGHDPSFWRDGKLAGVPEDQNIAAGYEPGIYCGIFNSFYFWSNQPVIIKNMPLKFADIWARGEAVIPAKKIGGQVIQKRGYVKDETGRVIFNSGITDMTNAEVEPYDDPSHVFANKLAGRQLHVPKQMLEVFQRYFPEARIEYKHIRTEDLPLDVGSIEIPYIVLPKDARKNLLKIDAIREATRIANVIIE